MSNYHVELRYFVRELDRDALDAHVNAMMSALLIEPGLTDPDVGVNFTTGAVDVSVEVDAEDDPTALRTALVAIRSAAHSIGAGTPGWDTALRQVSSHVRPAEMAEA